MSRRPITKRDQPGAGRSRSGATIATPAKRCSAGAHSPRRREMNQAYGVRVSSEGNVRAALGRGGRKSLRICRSKPGLEGGRMAGARGIGRTIRVGCAGNRAATVSVVRGKGVGDGNAGLRARRALGVSAHQRGAALARLAAEPWATAQRVAGTRRPSLAPSGQRRVSLLWRLDHRAGVPPRPAGETGSGRGVAPAGLRGRRPDHREGERGGGKTSARTTATIRRGVATCTPTIWPWGWRRRRRSPRVRATAMGNAS